MSKRTRRTLASLLATLAVLATLAIAPLGVAQGPVATTKSARNAAVVAATDAVLKEISELRQLSILRPVQSGTQSRPEIEGMIIKDLDEEMTPAEMHANEVVLKKLGLAPQDFQYRSSLIKLLTEQVAGYYDPKTREFYLADWIDLDGQKPIMAHELTHALQDQHFNLRRFEHWPKGDSDAELAAHALIEGDATLSMTLYVASNPMRALEFLKSLSATGLASSELDQAPRALRETLLFPYQEGIYWTRALYQENGWNQVSRAFTDLPRSTHQIMHPEKYFAHEAPVKVTLPDIRPFLGAGWKRIDYDIDGEWSIYLILDQFLKSPVESRRAAAGWEGDRFEVYEGPKDQVFVASLSAWDSQADARNFFDAYATRTERRYSGAEPLSLANTGALTADVRRIWRTHEGFVVMELRGKRVLILEGVPFERQMKRLLAIFWQ